MAGVQVPLTCLEDYWSFMKKCLSEVPQNFYVVPFVNCLAVGAVGVDDTLTVEGWDNHELPKCTCFALPSCILGSQNVANWLWIIIVKLAVVTGYQEPKNN